MQTPNAFVLPKPLDNDTCPPPKPPSYMKHQVYDDPHVFEKVDCHAIRVAKNNYLTFRDLLWDLVFHYKLNELEKARVIFRWMTACDMKSLSFQNVQKDSPEEVLLSLQNLKGSYANVLQLMCSYAGIYCLTISGFAKGVDYRPGDVFQEKAFNHSWNVLYIQDSWQLIDAHWATRYLSARKNTEDSIVYQYDDFYFIMEPQQAVYSHFPENPAWQLMEQPLTINQFQNLPLTKSQFFKCGMDFNEQHHGVVYSKDGNLKMALGFWKPDSFTYKLVFEDNSDSFNGIPLKHFVVQETANNKINFYFRFPKPGNYYLTIFVQELTEHNQPTNQENIFRAACEYKIVADKVLGNTSPYPMTCHDPNWGPQWSLVSHYNLVPVQEDGVISIKSPDGKPFVRTEIRFEKLRDEVGLLCKLRKNGVEDEEVLDQYIEIIEKADQTSFVLNLPEPGEYGLEIYANEPSEGDTYTHICQYLLDFEPPPNYKPQTSVFGPTKGGSTSLSHKPSNIREMYNYEHHAASLGVLPKPYLVSQYAPEDATMIPGQTKTKPKPFAYNETNKAGESDMEMPNFLPPPPPITIVPHFEQNVSSSSYGDHLHKGNSKYAQPQSTDDRINQLNDVSRPMTGPTGRYSPSSQRMAVGDNMSQGGHSGASPAYLQGAKPFTKSSIGVNDPITIHDSVYHVGSSQRSQPGEKTDDELLEQTVKLQPYLANIEKGQSPNLSRKVHDYTGGNRNTDPKDSSAKFSSASKEGASIKASPSGLGPSRYTLIDERTTLSQMNIVSSAFGKSDDAFSGQPYLRSIETGNSPTLSRKSVPYHSNQGRPSDSHNVSDQASMSIRSDPNSDIKKPSVFRGYGRPNFNAGENAGGNANVPDNRAQAAPTPGSSVNPALKGSIPYKEETSKLSGPTHVSGTYGVRNPADTDKSSVNINLQRNSPYKEESSKISDPGYMTGSYGVRNSASANPAAQGGSAEGRKDPSKISNIAVTLSPSGFKKPNQGDMTSDQYNKQYQDSLKMKASPIQSYIPQNSTANWTSGPVQKEPPKNFQLKPVDIEEEILKPEVQTLPTEYPSALNINEETSKIFQRIDDHAMQVSEQHQESFNQLIWQLIYAREITDELEKVRVIFLWLCTKDLHKMNFDDVKADSPEEILMGLKTGKSTYAQIFVTLCRYAGLHCKLIVGYAKGADYVPGMRFQARHGEHSWNAVLIGGVWRLIDCHWAARRLIGKERKPENVRYELDMYYFLANPSQLIYTHYPHDHEWQLLHHTIGIEEFESLAPVKSTFFKYNLDLVTHKNSVINSATPEFELKIAFPKGVEEKLLFTFTLTLTDGSDSFKGVPLTRYGRQEMDYCDSHSSFYIRAPAPGSYKLLLYAKLISDPGAVDSGSENVFGAICEYKVEFSFPSGQAKSAFPACQTTTYGPSEAYRKYAIEACSTKSSIRSDNGTAEIKFLIHKPDIRVMAKLIGGVSETSDQLTDQCVLQRVIGGSEAVMSVFLPSAGEYGLEVYANNPSRDGNSFYTVWQYFLVAGRGSGIEGLPSLPPGYLGPSEPRFSGCGLSTLSHRDPFISGTAGGDVTVRLATTRDRPVRLLANLLPSGHILQQTRDSVVTLLLRLPHRGFFRLQIFALPIAEASAESLPGVFNYLVEATGPSLATVPEFPTQFAHWREGCYLHEPIDGVLGVAERPDWLPFKVEVPRAVAVAVVMGDRWTRLEADGQGGWAGRADMRGLWGQPNGGEAALCANYGSPTDESFTTLLRYVIK